MLFRLSERRRNREKNTRCYWIYSANTAKRRFVPREMLQRRAISKSKKRKKGNTRGRRLCHFFCCNIKTSNKGEILCFVYCCRPFFIILYYSAKYQYISKPNYITHQNRNNTSQISSPLSQYAQNITVRLEREEM